MQMLKILQHNVYATVANQQTAMLTFIIVILFIPDVYLVLSVIVCFLLVLKSYLSYVKFTSRHSISNVVNHIALMFVFVKVV